MLSFLKNMFTPNPEVDLGDLINKGTPIIDVRSKGEFEQAHLRGSVNIPLKNLEGQLNKYKKDKPVIVCCASGARSASARSMMRSQGFLEVYNAGPWTNLRKYSR